jgi:AraC-like DNA-binding protein
MTGNSRQKAPESLWLVPAYNAVLILEEATRQGVNPRELVRGTGFSLKDLQNSETLKSYDQARALIERALRLCPLPGLGLRIGRNESPTQWGILGYAVMCCKTLRAMLEMVVKYHRIAASMAEFYFREEGDYAVLETRPPLPLHGALPFVVEEHFSAILAAARIVTDRPGIRPSELQLSYAAPAYAAMYRDFFGCRPQFSQASNLMVFDKKWLNLPVRHTSALSSHMAERICELQLQRQYLERDLVHRVRYLLLAHTDTFPDAEQVAEMLHMTSRTLRNRLRAQNASFQSILDDVRHQLAADYLEHSKLGLTEIASLVGFNDTSNFRRALKKWTGKSPTQLRPAQDQRGH